MTTEAAGARITVRGVSRRPILTGISLDVGPGGLLAIIGGSGAGKTTLLEALAGIRRPDAGEVLREGAFGPPGFVPQDDIVHRELPLARTLRYEARLRLPAGTTRAEIDRRVEWVLAALDLTAKSGQRVGWLSGGERKRASIAVELLTRPPVLFLDEPTSGLDPATAAEVMRLLRGLAASGTTTVLTTHNPPDVEFCDRIAVLSPDGTLAFTGTPAEALEHFRTPTISGIYTTLNGASALRNERPTMHDTQAGDTSGQRIGPVRQCGLLVRRTLDILVRNRLTLAILVGSPVMVLAMFALLFKPGAFSPTHPNPGTTVMILFWIAFGGFFFGLTYGLLQICTEAAVLRRERLAGLSATAYVLSKVGVLLPLLVAVDALMLAVLRVLDRLPSASWSAYGEVMVTLTLSSAAALTLGLLISAAVTDPSQATLALPMLCFPQVLFVGAILPVPVMASGGRWISYAMSNRWAFEALGHSLGIRALWSSGASPLGPPLLASYGTTFDHALWLDWLILATLTLTSLTSAIAVVAHRNPHLPTTP
ncbi:ABC transporter ATP-binding protein/permease [Actinomadura rupiterrae]|uniref:ABC transporter ATP-binding protein/permease n=1 Tax=Actinomadura rupiterrae TaxID=559627 RepID=UPI0020A5A9C4|nr:ATP-binding cassette domain-containing protein [Actinomadura rupiterrae]MCP2339032.1 ABC-type multidrug transport system ATPase subunit [Actinomadura rupiterrae]